MKCRIVLSFLLLWLINLNAIACFRRTAHLKDYANNGDDVTTLLQCLVDKYDIVIIDEGVWYISDGIRLHSDVIIKGVGASKSVLRVKDALRVHSGMLFYTVALNPDIYVNRCVEDNFKRSRIKYRNIRIEDLTVDLSRDPTRFSDKELKSKNLYAIALIHAASSSVSNCSFIDQMTKECNNGYPAIVVFQSEDVTICNNYINNISFVQAIYSKQVKVIGNQINCSIGTAIETIGGKDHQIIDNNVKKVIWDVSCIGINSLSNLVEGNTVNAASSNISCITIGHEGETTCASNTTVVNNSLFSEGCRTILVQNGYHVSIANNNCNCILTKLSSELSSGCVVASGQSEDIQDITINNNQLRALGESSCGCITYRGSGHASILNNTIIASRGISVFADNNTDVEISGNLIESSMYSIQANCGFLLIRNNTLTDGIVSSAFKIKIQDNRISHSSHHSYLGKNWESVIIQDNLFLSEKKRSLPYAFMLDASEKTGSFDVKSLLIEGNKKDDEYIKKVLSISGTQECPQLEYFNRNVH